MEGESTATGPILNAIDPDLCAFKGRGGKMIMYHGWIDNFIAPRNSIQYVKIRMFLENTGPEMALYSCLPRQQEGHGLCPWMNAPAFGRDVAPLGREEGGHGLCPWGSTGRSYPTFLNMRVSGKSIL